MARKTSAAERFWPKIDKRGPVSLIRGVHGNCWTWVASLDKRGYGQFFDGNTMVKAYKWAYVDRFGPVAPGLDLDHRCRVRACCNPAHLEPVSHRVNVLRGMSPGAISYRTNRCFRGHEFTPANTGVRRDGSRICRKCDAARSRAYQARKQAAQATTERTAA